MNPALSWQPTTDGCANFFGAYLQRADLDLSPASHVLEIGCGEFDWLKVAAQYWPQMRFWGVDWRCSNQQHERTVVMQGDARQEWLYPPGSFDWIVSISAIEHMGLGHYDADPVDPDGDTQVIANAFTWLKPGGWLTFDVPWQPSGFEVCGTSHRLYDPDSLFLRLWCEPLARAKCTARWHGTWYARSNETAQLIDRPTQRDGPFYYVGVAWRKL